MAESAVTLPASASPRRYGDAAREAPGERRSQRRKLGLRLALAILVSSTVALTALLIHLSWSYTARQNVADVVSQLNREIVDSIHHEVRGVLDDAWSMQEAVRSIFFQGTIRTTDEAKREFLFLSLLRSQPSLSWISLGFPNGNFFGAHKVSDDEIDMVEVKWNDAHDGAQRRIDYYAPDVGDIIFRNREVEASSYDATQEAWYRRAIVESGPGWTSAEHLPSSDRQAITTSRSLEVDNEFAGVVGVVIELQRLSQFLETVHVGKTGTAVILGRDGGVIASADPRAIKQQEDGEMPRLSVLGDGNSQLRAVSRALERDDVDLGSLADARQLRIRGEYDRDYFVTLAPLKFDNWVVATVIPASDFLATIDRSAELLLIGLAVLTILMAALAILAANRLIGTPLARIAGELKHIESFDLANVRHIPSHLRELDGLSAALVQMSRGLASFQKYMPTALVRTLVSRGIEARPGGRQETLTVLFTDIAGFTSLSERLGEAVVNSLTEYLELASAAIHERRGTIDKFIGDAVMAFWGAPVPSERHAIDACAAALDLQQRLRQQREEAERGGRPAISIRIGINTGRMLVGNIGSRERLSYTVIGDPVNVASRLEAVNKRYGTEILIGEDTRATAGDAILVRRLDRVAVYGRMQGLWTFELLAIAAEDSARAPDWVRAYEAGLDAYAAREWQAAIAHFERADRARGGDQPSQLLIERCRRLIAEPPPADWSPVLVLDGK
jgi:adenylate cyclase